MPLEKGTTGQGRFLQLVEIHKGGLQLRAFGQQHSEHLGGMSHSVLQGDLCGSPLVLFSSHTGLLPKASGPPCLLFLSLKLLVHYFPLLYLLNSCSLFRSYLIGLSTGKLLPI